MKSLLALICVATLCVILSLGLWPFHAPDNDVVWLKNQDGLHFGPYGSALSSGTFPSVSQGGGSEVSLVIYFRPQRIWDSGTLLAFYTQRNLFQFSLRQSQDTLVLETNPKGDLRRDRTAALTLDEALHRENRPVFLSITAGRQGTSVYLNGRLAKADPGFPLSAKDLSGYLVLGDSPGQSDSWGGEIRSLAIYNCALTPKQVFDHYSTSVHTGRPEITGDEHYIALYLFRERNGRVVRNQIRSGVDLYIPKKYQVMGKIALEPFWTEFEMTRSYWEAALKNIVGFIPLGFWFYAYLTVLLPGKRVALLTVSLGTAVSLTIEILQAFLPTRDSGTTDIITNTMGTWAGVALYNISTPILFGLFAWWPFPPPPSKRPKATI
jgi:glycopeptide antibiotics resistance protein